MRKYKYNLYYDLHIYFYQPYMTVHVLLWGVIVTSEYILYSYLRSPLIIGDDNDINKSALNLD